MARRPLITPDIYRKLLAAFREGKPIRTAAAEAGCPKHVAEVAWSTGYIHTLPWALPIRDVVSGVLPEPGTSPLVPKMPKPQKPQSNVIQIAPPKRPPAPIAPADGSPDELLPDAPPLEPIEYEDDEDDAERLAQQNALIASARRSLYRQLKSIEKQGPLMAACTLSLLKTIHAYTESIAKGQPTTVQELTALAGALGATSMVQDRLVTSAERIVNLERTLNPSKPKEKPKMDRQSAEEMLARAAARYKALTSSAKPPAETDDDEAEPEAQATA